MNRLEQKLQSAKESNAKLFCGYITLGYPSLAFTEKLIRRFDAIGVDVLELGIPFSDPLADGPTIQAAAYESLKKQTKVKDAFALVKSIRSKGVTMPIVFFSYYNPIMRMGVKRFVKSLVVSGIDAVLCPDLPPGVDTELETTLKEHNISLIFLVAPTTTDERMKFLVNAGSGFVYYVARRGVTGVTKEVAGDLTENVTRIKNVTDKRVLVGFGVSTPEQVKKISAVSDGVIVGSAIVNTIKETHSVEKTTQFVSDLVQATKGVA